MSMFCFQCQEAAKGTGCTVKGVCGKTDSVANLQDVLLYVLEGISSISLRAETTDDHPQIPMDTVNRFIMEGLFATITNANFDQDFFVAKIRSGLALRDNLLRGLARFENVLLHDALTWSGDTVLDFEAKAKTVGVMRTENPDIRSLRELVTYGVKGMAAYLHHADVLGHQSLEAFSFLRKALAALLDDSLSVDDLIALTMETGKFGVEAMALLDKANTLTYGHPEISKVNLGVRSNPGILVSGHDLKDLQELLVQTEGSGVDVYTHGEMLPAHYYPVFQNYPHFVGNYGNAWWKQGEEFARFHGPILMTTNCLVPPKEGYKDRVYTTGVVGFSGLTHIPDRQGGEAKDFSGIIAHAKQCPPPEALEEGEIVGGFAHQTVLGMADTVIDAVKSGAIKKFVVMAGCDGRMKSRDYYQEFAEQLPNDTVILTAGCAKYRYNKLNLGDIGGIPRVLDAGQCNDSYSLAVIALQLKEAFALSDINDLPIVYNIAWYEQKAVIVLLALLYLGVKNIHLGPTLPAFLSENVANVLIEKFGIAGAA